MASGLPEKLSVTMYPHQTRQQWFGQMGGEWWRHVEVWTDGLGGARRTRETRESGLAGLLAPHPFPYRITDHEDPPHTDGPQRGCGVLRQPPQDGLRRRFRGLRRRSGRRLRRHTILQ